MKTSKIIRKITIMSLGFSMYLFSSLEHVGFQKFDGSGAYKEQQDRIAKLLQEHDKNSYVEKKTPPNTAQPQNVNQAIKTTNEPLDENEWINLINSQEDREPIDDFGYLKNKNNTQK